MEENAQSPKTWSYICATMKRNQARNLLMRAAFSTEEGVWGKIGTNKTWMILLAILCAIPGSVVQCVTGCSSALQVEHC